MSCMSCVIQLRVLGAGPWALDELVEVGIGRSRRVEEEWGGTKREAPRRHELARGIVWQ